MAKKVPAAKMEIVKFRKHEIQASMVNGSVVVGLHSLCDNLGIDYSGQLQRIKRRNVLLKTLGTAPMVAMDGKVRDMAYITLRGLTTWLVTIDTSRMPEKKKRAVERYQEEAADVLEKHFGPRLAEHLNLGHGTQGSKETVGPAYHDFTPPRTPPGEVEVYSPPATLADLAAFGVELKKDFMDNLSKNMPEILKHAMEGGGKRSFMSQWRDKTRAYIAETIAEDLSQNEDEMDGIRESVEKVRDRVIELEKNHKRLSKIITADKALRAKAKQEMLVELDEIRDEIKSLKRIVKPAKKKKATTTTKKKRVLN